MSKTKDLIPYEVILAAIEGNVDSINQILRYFEPYINELCKRKVKAPGKGEHYQIDEFMKLRIETELIAKILKFKIIPEELI